MRPWFYAVLLVFCSINAYAKDAVKAALTIPVNGSGAVFNYSLEGKKVDLIFQVDQQDQLRQVRVVGDSIDESGVSKNSLNTACASGKRVACNRNIHLISDIKSAGARGMDMIPNLKFVPRALVVKVDSDFDTAGGGGKVTLDYVSQKGFVSVARSTTSFYLKRISGQWIASTDSQGLHKLSSFTLNANMAGGAINLEIAPHLAVPIE